MTQLSENSPVWSRLVQGTYNPKLSCLALQIKLNFLKISVANRKVAPADAARQLFAYCVQNEQVIENDIPILK